MKKQTRAAVTRACVLLVLALALGAGVFALIQRQNIEDFFAAASFDPSPRVTQVAERLHLTPEGERIFLASEPTVDGSQHFNEQCADVDHSEQGHVLGCYAHERIHLYNVADERISGVVEVTAAHELMHAVWIRLSDGERSELTKRLRAVYDDLAKDDSELSERMSVYQHLSASAFANELHSVLGTEVRRLPDWLEKHYARWCQDRGIFVDFFDDYHAVFVELQAEADALQQEMTALREDVETRNEAYESAVAQFNVDVADFNARNERYEFSDDPDGFEQLRDALRQRRIDLESQLETLQTDIDRYNDMRDQLQELGEVSTELDQQLDSDLAPVSTHPDA